MSGVELVDSRHSHCATRAALQQADPAVEEQQRMDSSEGNTTRIAAHLFGNTAPGGYGALLRGLPPDAAAIAMGPGPARLNTGPDEVLAAYVGILARLRRARLGPPIQFRADDLGALSTALGLDPDHVEAQIAVRSAVFNDHGDDVDLVSRKLTAP